MHIPSFLVGTFTTGGLFLIVHQQTSFRSRLTYKWQLAGKRNVQVLCPFYSRLLVARFVLFYLFKKWNTCFHYSQTHIIFMFCCFDIPKIQHSHQLHYTTPAMK